jgi:cold shock CspA family protein
MAKPQQTFAKKDRHKRKQKDRMEKHEKRMEKKTQPKKTFEEMIAYVDENGNFSSTPPIRKEAVKAEDIEIGVPKQADVLPEDLIRKGTVTFLNESKGYGFIKDAASGESVFVHVSEVKDAISDGSKVTFETARGPRGTVAVNVHLA